MASSSSTSPSTLSSSSRIQQAVKQATHPDFSSLELLSPLPLWRSPTASSCEPSAPHIAVLDSSFNPPTLAHLSIASSSFPPPDCYYLDTKSNAESGPGPYTARLLLFSTRNADKKLKPGDATIFERSEMMLIQSQSMGSNTTSVALINEPTFVGKSRTIQHYLTKNVDHDRKIKPTLTFLVGTDTLVRFFDPKYYPNDTMNKAMSSFFEEDGSYLVCARRGGNVEDREMEDKVLNQEEVKKWVRKGKVRMLNERNKGWEDISSTKIREAVKDVRELKGLCTAEIEEYIFKHGLYQT